MVHQDKMWYYIQFKVSIIMMYIYIMVVYYDYCRLYRAQLMKLPLDLSVLNLGGSYELLYLIS